MCACSGVRKRQKMERLMVELYRPCSCLHFGEHYIGTEKRTVAMMMNNKFVDENGRKLSQWWQQYKLQSYVCKDRESQLGVILNRLSSVISRFFLFDSVAFLFPLCLHHSDGLSSVYKRQQKGRKARVLWRMWRKGRKVYYYCSCSSFLA